MGPTITAHQTASRRTLRRTALPGVLLTLALTLAPHAPAAAESTPRGDVDGTVVAAYDATLAFPIDGVVGDVAVAPGDRVASGAVLAKLDDAEAKLNVDLTRAAAESDVNVRLAEQRLELAKQEQAGAAPAAAMGNGNPQRAKASLRLAELELERQRLRHQQAQREHDLALVRLRRHALSAPVDAVVEQVLVSPGSFVAAGQPIVRLVQPDTLLVEAQTPSDRAAGLTEGAHVAIYPRTVGDAAPALPGRIVSIAATLDPQTDSRLVRIVLEGRPALLPGAQVGVDLDPPAPKNNEGATPSDAETPDPPGSATEP